MSIKIQLFRDASARIKVQMRHIAKVNNTDFF